MDMSESTFSEIATIESFNAFNSEIYGVCLRIPDDHSFTFTAGQYLLLVLDEKDKRPFSIASAPEALPSIELHIRDIPGNEFMQQAIQKLKHSKSIAIEGPFGCCVISEPLERDITFIVGGTGFAPAKSIIENLLVENKEVKINLFRGARTTNELYEFELAEDWSKKVSGIEFTPVISEADPDWQGATGFVHNVAIEKLGDELQDHDIYIAGSVEMVMAVYQDLLAAGIEKSQIHADMLDLLREQGELD